MLRIISYSLLFILSLASSAFAVDDLKSAPNEGQLTDSLKSIFSDGKITFQFRNYYFRRDFDTATTMEDLAAGGMLYYKTASFHGISLGTAFYTAQGMGLNDSRKRTYSLLASDHESFSVLGESYIQYVWDKTTVRIGRQEMNTPWVNKYDIRLTPQSTESYTLYDKSFPDIEIVFSHVTKMRGRTSTDFVSMTEFAGITTADEPVTLAGVIYTGIKGLKLQLWDFYGHEFLNNVYIRGDYSREIKEDLAVFGAFQYLNQHDVGDSVGGAIDTGNFTIMAGIKVRGAKLSLAVSDNGDDNIFISWGHDFIVDTTVYRPFRAESTSLQATLCYDFIKMGIQGLDGKVSYTDFNTPDNGTNASPDRDAICFELNYKFEGFFKGLGLKWRLGFYDNDEDLGGDDVRDMRFYVKYSF